MKLYELKLKNLNSFREEITLDFENGSLAGASLVAITGPTGSGKTTLFDAICVALYGKTPRLPGDGEAKALLSLGETEGSAEVIFEANGIRYRAKWSVKQGDSPSGWLTNVDTGAVITERLSRRGKRVGASENTVSEEIESVLGLDFDAFRRSVMLAQGDFTAFLKAGNKKRLEILETVADTGIYNDLAETLREKVQSVKDVYNEVQEKVHNIPKPSDQEIAEAEEKLSQLEKKTNSLAAKKEQWERIKKAATGRRTSFGELQSAATAVGEAETTRDAEQKRCNQQQDKLDALNTDYRKAVPEHQNKRDAHIAARSDVQQAQSQFAQAENLIPNLQELDEQIHALSNQLTEYEKRQREALEAMPETGTLEEWRARRKHAQQALPIARDYETTHRQLDETAGEVAKLKERLTALDTSLKEVAGQLEIQMQVCKRADAQVSQLEAELALAVLAAPVNQLKRELEPGKPCRVCGAPEHPCAEALEHDGEERLKPIESALAAAKADAQAERKEFQNLERGQSDCETEKTIRTDQLGASEAEVEKLTRDMATLSGKWQAIYPAIKISSVWTSQQIQAAEGAIDAFLELGRLQANIGLPRQKLESAKEQRKSVHASIERYQREGNAYLDAAREKTGGLRTEDGIDAAIENLDAELQELRSQRGKAEQVLQRSKTLLTQAQTIYDQSVSSLKEHAVNLETAHETYLEKSRDAGFDEPGAHDNAFRTWMQEVRDAIDAYTQETRAPEVDTANLPQVEETPFDSLESKRIAAELAKIDDEAREVERNIGAQESRIAALKEARSAHKAHEDEIEKAKREMERWSSLQDVFLYNSKRASTNDLRSFAAEIMLQQVSQFANAQLESLTSGRYQLKVENIGKLSVIDRWNVNEERPVETLSGGESFLTSLALALALSELSRGRAEIGALFLDEGFGTLDAETLDVAISALEGLRLQGRSIFLISHIQELTRRLPVKINVRKRGNGSSTVRVQG